MAKPQNFPNHPEKMWDQFYNITRIPRPSKHEQQMVAYLESIAKENELDYTIDQVQNVIIRVPGTNGRENDAPVIIQNHIDMVTDATADKKINFREDPIETFVENGWLKADRTTLGADNGIGCAAALATIFDKTLTHPPLELLFTTDEETGLNGALNLEANKLTGRKMLNLDTEEWGSVYIGCAGGIDYEFTRDLDFTPVKGHAVKISLGGLIGGHSGLDIHEQRGNAIKLLVEVLAAFQAQDNNEFNNNYRIVEFSGGRAHNIIPRDSFVVLAIEQVDQIQYLEQKLQEISEQWLSYLPKNDQNFELTIERLFFEADEAKKALSFTESKKLINFLNLFPHGAHKFDLASNRELVSMSNNLARVLIMNGKFYLQSSLRFFDRNEVRSLESQLISLGETFGMQVTSNSEYPSWKPERENKVLETVQMKYKELFGQDIKVTAIHAGLECGILKDKMGAVEVVSFGPTIMGAHSPDERVDIETVAKFWQLFKGVLEVI